jgi:hypothetical protein
MVRGIDELSVGGTVVPGDELKSVRTESCSRERRRLGGEREKGWTVERTCRSSCRGSQFRLGWGRFRSL